ncbi:MAG: hypothetical protein FD151_1913 [bacterium]|nr:MAG: hypothetical protein FD151_1913 [bacterium]
MSDWIAIIILGLKSVCYGALKLGKDTEEISKTLGGYSEQQIQQLKREEVV